MEFYNKDYFERQKKAGEFGGKVELFKFENFVRSNDTIVDFGCGGGYLLSNLLAQRKIGVEINDAARQVAASFGIETVRTVEELPDNCADLIISNHALEHVTCPHDILTQFHAKIKPDARLVFVVPHQTIHQRFVENDSNMHIYTWNPLTLGNLFITAGYKVHSIDVIRSAWPPDRAGLRSLATGQSPGPTLFRILCYAYAWYQKKYQLRILASAQ